MKSRMHLGAALEDRLGWASFPISASEERDAYTAMCAAWAAHVRRTADADATVRAKAQTKTKTQLPSPPPQRRGHADSHAQAYAHDEYDGATVRPAAGAHPLLRLHHAQSHTHLPAHTTPAPLDGPGGEDAHLQRSARRKSAPGRPALSSLSPAPAPASASALLLPSERLTTAASAVVVEEERAAAPSARTGRVFVGWKP